MANQSSPQASVVLEKQEEEEAVLRQLEERILRENEGDGHGLFTVFESEREYGSAIDSQRGGRSGGGHPPGNWTDEPTLTGIKEERTEDLTWGRDSEDTAESKDSKESSNGKMRGRNEAVVQKERKPSRKLSDVSKKSTPNMSTGKDGEGHKSLDGAVSNSGSNATRKEREAGKKYESSYSREDRIRGSPLVGSNGVEGMDVDADIVTTDDLEDLKPARVESLASSRSSESRSSYSSSGSSSSYRSRSRSSRSYSQSYSRSSKVEPYPSEHDEENGHESDGQNGHITSEQRTMSMGDRAKRNQVVPEPVETSEGNTSDGAVGGGGTKSKGWLAMTTYKKKLGKVLDGIPKDISPGERAKIMWRRSSLKALESHNQAKKKFAKAPRTRSEIQNMNKTVSLNHRLMIHPEAAWKSRWDWFIVVLVIYNAFFIPWDIGFNGDIEAETPEESGGRVIRGTAYVIFQTLDYIIDACFVIDIMMNFRTAYLERGIAISDPKVVGRRYLKNWFVIDFLASMPFELLSYIAPSAFMVGPPGKQFNLFVFFRLPRLLRLRRFFYKLDKVRSFLNFLRIFKMLLIFVLVAHWFGCFWFMIGYYVEMDNNSWLIYYNITDKGIGTEMLYSYYWSLTTMTTVGYGDMSPQTNAERLYTMAVFVVGALIYATIFGSVAVLLQNFDRAGARYREKMEAISEFVNFYNIPAEFHQRIADHVDHLWQRHGGMDVSAAVGDLPDALRTEVLMHLHGTMIRELQVFQECEEGFLRSVVMRLKPQVCLPGESIIEENDPATTMFLLRKGKLHVGSANRASVYAVHGDNSIVGELALITGKSTRTASVWAADFCDLYYLEKGDFQYCCMLFPQSLEVMKKNVGKRIENYKKRISVEVWKAGPQGGEHGPNHTMHNLESITRVEGDIKKQIQWHEQRRGDDENESMYGGSSFGPSAEGDGRGGGGGGGGRQVVLAAQAENRLRAVEDMQGRMMVQQEQILARLEKIHALYFPSV
mmetsp:Transcript_42657/g.109858  ORF Transcript_42657/g.109858 Transcript_42657/m.109858 type:complete len:993 (-) Transcript_42657:1305-4283(-)